MRLIVIGDVHAQEAKLWHMLRRAGVRSRDGHPNPALLKGDMQVVLLGDLVHPKERRRYAQLIETERYDEFNPEHLRRAEQAQEAFLRRLKAFTDPLPEGAFTILLGNHDYNAITAGQGPLRSDDLTHLEWKPGYGTPLPDDLIAWIASWPTDRVIEGIHLAHVGPKPEHNHYDQSFYLENRRAWIHEDIDYLAGTPYRIGMYGHTPVRGGLNLASKGRAFLMDGCGHADEYVWAEVRTQERKLRVRMHGLVFDETLEL